MVKQGTEKEDVARGRFEAWLEIEKARVAHQMRQGVEEENERRAKQEPPLKPLQVPQWNERRLSPERVELARLACSMTAQERQNLKADFSAKSESLSEEDWQRAQDALVAWEIGEEKRSRVEQIEAARQNAATIIHKRSAAPEANELNFADCFRSFGPEGGGFHGNSEWRPEVWEKLPDDKRAFWLQKWERVERLLPVYYEYARESVSLLHLAVMQQTIDEESPKAQHLSEAESDAPRLGGCWIHPLEGHVRDGIEQLHSRIGGFAQALIQNLNSFLVRDVPFPLIPTQERKWAASFAMSCNAHHCFMGPFLADAGPVSDPWVVPEVERERVRLASTEEATTTGQIQYTAHIAKEVYGVPMYHQDIIDFAGALNATTSDSRCRDKQTERDYWCRRINEEGEEVLALKIVWKDTRDSELVEAFQNLVRHIRPDHRAQEFRPKAQWPERPSTQRGKKWQQESEAALNALLALRKRRSAKMIWEEAKAIHTSKDKEFTQRQKMGKMRPKEQATLEKELEQARQRAAVAGNECKSSMVKGAIRGTATNCFRKIVGPDEIPWWAESCR